MFRKIQTAGSVNEGITQCEWWAWSVSVVSLKCGDETINGTDPVIIIIINYVLG